MVNQNIDKYRKKHGQNEFLVCAQSCLQLIIQQKLSIRHIQTGFFNTPCYDVTPVIPKCFLWIKYTAWKLCF